MKTGGAGYRIGVDVGGTKIEGVLLDSAGQPVESLRRPAPRGDYSATLSAICDAVVLLDKSCPGTPSVGIGIPGSLSPATGKVQNANSAWLNGQALHHDLAARLGRPVRIANDANCFAVSESVDGAGAGAPSVWGIILGTGCGSGFVINRTLVDGPRGIGGEWGHNPLPWPLGDEIPGPQCWCGRRGCIESWVSGPALERDHTRHTGKTCSPEDICRQATAGDRTAAATLTRHGSRLARAMAHVMNILDPHVIVLGGGLSKMQHLYTALPEEVAPFLFADHGSADIRRPRWGDASGVRGAAWLWKPEEP